MKRFVALVGCVAVVACSAPAAETTTTTLAPTTSTTSTTTSTTLAPTTTTTLPSPQVDSDDPELAAMIEALYQVAQGGPAPAAPENVVAALSTAEGTPPDTATATIAAWDEATTLAVVTAGDDVTLAAADPTWRIIGGWWPSLGVAQELGAFPKVIAVVGSDARPNQRRDATRADSIHFVGLDGAGGAGIVGVPRDSWVPIPGRGSSRINAPLALSGPDLMMETFESVSGLEFDGYLLTGFAGFESLIELLGGLDMDVPRNFSDKAAKAYIEAGRQILSGADALAVSRARKTLPTGDFMRQEHGGLVILAAQAMVRAAGVETLPSLLAGARPYVSTDLTPAELLTLAAATTRVDPDTVENVVAPGRTGTAGSASVVFLQDSADLLWEDLADGRLDPADN